MMPAKLYSRTDKKISDSSYNDKTNTRKWISKTLIRTYMHKNMNVKKDD